MFVVVLDHLLDVNLVVVVAVVADVLSVADPVAAVNNGATDWRDNLYLCLTPVPATRCATWETTPWPVPTRPCRCRLANATRMYGP